MGAPLIISDEVERGLASLRDTAGRNPLDMAWVMEQVKTPAGRKRLDVLMSKYTMLIPGPFPFKVTYSVEQGHPSGTMRHFSMSIRKEGSVPSPEALWMVAEKLGFSGSLRMCMVYMEDATGGGKAVNVVQLLAIRAEASDVRRA